MADEEWALTLYQALREHGGFPSDEELRRVAGLSAEQGRRGARRLRELGLVQVSDGLLAPVDPDTALVQTMNAYRVDADEQARTAIALQQRTRALMTVYRPAVALEAAQVEVEHITDRRRKDSTLRDLHEMCRESAESLHPGPMPPIEVLENSLRLDKEAVDQGVRVRAIYPLSVLQTPRYARYLHELAEIGAEVRCIDHAPHDLLVFDKFVACLPSDPDDPSHSMLVIRGAALIKTYTAVYEDLWLRSVPYDNVVRTAPRPGAAETELTAQERVVIRLMAVGLTDDQIARKMGVHRRTVQRAVAKLMDRLHASSRFEAGLKLAQDPEFVRALRAAAPGAASAGAASPGAASAGGPGGGLAEPGGAGAARRAV